MKIVPSRMSMFIFALLVVLAGLLPPTVARGSEDCSSGACFPNSITVDGEELVLRSTHLFRYWGFRVYSLALYTAPELRDSNLILTDVPKRLVLHYHRRIAAEDMIRGAETVIPREPSNNVEALRERLDQVNSAYVDVVAGDQYAITYFPEKGTTITLNGEAVVNVPGADFAQAYFGIWLGEKGLNEGLRRAMLTFKD